MDLIILKDGLYSIYSLDIYFNNVMECLDYGNILREKVAVYLDNPENRWVMKNGMGDWFGFICQNYGAEAPQ